MADKFSSISVAQCDKWNCCCKHNQNIEISLRPPPPEIAPSSSEDKTKDKKKQQPSQPRLALAGFTFAASDSFLVKGHCSCAGNPDWLRTHGPAEETAQVIKTLVSNGATLVAKTVMDELAYCLTGVNVHFGTPINPCSPTLIPGGSSSGAAVAVASHLVDFAIGTDAGGSVRVPAAFCSVLGLRPTCSRISLNGLVPFSPSIQCVGIYAREPQVMLRIAQILLPSSSTASSSSFSISVQPNCLIVPSQAFDLVHDPSVRYKLDEFISFLKTFIPCQKDQRFDLIEQTKSVNKIIGFEAWKNHKDWIEQNHPKFSNLIAARFADASKISQEEGERALEHQRHFRAEMDKLMSGSGNNGDEFNVIVVPTAPGIAYKREVTLSETESFRFRTLQLNYIAGLAGLPQINLNLLHDGEGNAIGVSLIGPSGKDLELVNLANTIIEKYHHHQQQLPQS